MIDLLSWNDETILSWEPVRALIETYILTLYKWTN